MPKTYNTPHRTFVVKTRLTEEEHSFFLERMKNYEMSQSEFIRQAIDGAVVKPIIRVNPVNDEVLATLGKLVAEYNKIGNNINQIARTLNEWRNPYPQLAADLLNSLIEKIVIHEGKDSQNGMKAQPIEIYYRFIGKID